MSDNYNDKTIDSLRIDHEFGVIQFRFSDGSLMQYTRCVGQRLFSPQVTTTEDGKTAINASVTSEEFNLIVEAQRKRQ